MEVKTHHLHKLYDVKILTFPRNGRCHVTKPDGGGGDETDQTLH